MKGTITLYTERGHPFVKYKAGDTLGDSDTLLNVKLLFSIILLIASKG
jgi:hypothetical protein